MVSVVSSQLDYIRENKDAIVEANLIEELNVFIRLLEIYFDLLDEIYNESSLADIWRQTLTPLDYDLKELKSFNLVKSVGPANWFTYHKPVVCASYITDQHTHRYHNEGYGWCYKLDSLKSVIGMCPEDFGSGLPLDSKRWSADYTYATLDDVYYFHNTLNFRVGQADVLRFYPPDELMKQSKKKNTYNEILLDASKIEPYGVFVACETLKDCEQTSQYKHASTMASWYQKPLVVYGKAENAVNITVSPTRQ